MEGVFENLYVGDESDCRGVGSGWAVVHACKHPCHQDAVGYSGNLSQDHPEYLVAERSSDLYLNLVDMDRQLSHEYTEPIVSEALDFIGGHRGTTQVLVHCNQGRSRSPAIALLYLAKRVGELPNSSYTDAMESFRQVYPGYLPGRGVESYLHEFWPRLE